MKVATSGWMLLFVTVICVQGGVACDGLAFESEGAAESQEAALTVSVSPVAAPVLRPATSTATFTTAAALCTTTAGTPTLGTCSDNGCARGGGVCKAVDSDRDGTWDTCRCQKKANTTLGTAASYDAP